MNLSFKRVDISYLDAAMDIISDAKQLLSVDSLQWQQGYPSIDTIKNDITNDNLFGLFNEDELIGVAALIRGVDNNYLEINGKWITSASKADLVIHRLALKKEYYHLHLGIKMITYAVQYGIEKKCHSIKVDTHKKNIAMQKTLCNTGFKYCGIIKLNSGEKDNLRLAYEKII